MCNDLTSLSFINWPNLEEITIGNGSFTSVTEITFGTFYSI